MPKCSSTVPYCVQRKYTKNQTRLFVTERAPSLRRTSSGALDPAVQHRANKSVARTPLPGWLAGSEQKICYGNMTEALLITPPISITGKGRVMRDKGREGGGGRRRGGEGRVYKKMKRAGR